MSNNKLNPKTEKELDSLVERVARKSGYLSGTETYKEYLEKKFNKFKKEYVKGAKKYRHKLSLKPSYNLDFAEEIKAYLSEGIIDLKTEGYSEEEALRLTLEKFDEAELQESFQDFMKEFDDFGMEEYRMKSKEWYLENGETIGLFYGGFTILGVTIGACIGFLASGGIPLFLNMGWIYTLIGAVLGAMIGVGCGLIAQGMIVARKK